MTARVSLRAAVAPLVWRLGAATMLIVLAFSMTGPVLAILLQQQGRSASLIGAFAMLPFLMVGLGIPLVPRLLARWGVLPVYRVGVVMELAGALGYALSDRLAVWTLASLVSGIGAAALWNATEALLAREAPPALRGRVMGLYQTSLGAALAIGPFVPGLLQQDARHVLWAAAAVVAVCVLLVTPGHLGRETPQDVGRSGTWRALRQVPWLVALAFAGGVFEAGQNAIGAAHASATGLHLQAAATVAGAIGVGSFLCQYPAGWLADRFALARVFTVAAGLLLVAGVGVAWADRAPALLWLCGWIWGGVGGALYTLTMVQVAHHFHGEGTAGGAAAMITGYTWGGTLGPLASGTAVEAAGVQGLAAWLGAVALAAFIAARRFARG